MNNRTGTLIVIEPRTPFILGPERVLEAAISSTIQTSSKSCENVIDTESNRQIDGASATSRNHATSQESLTVIRKVHTNLSNGVKLFLCVRFQSFHV